MGLSFWTRCLLMVSLESVALNLNQHASLAYAMSVPGIIQSADSRADNVHVDVRDTMRGRTTIDVYGQDYIQTGSHNGNPAIVICNNNGDDKKNCQNIVPGNSIEARSSLSGILSQSNHRPSHSNPHQTYPPYVNNGNAVHIQGNFQGSPPSANLNNPNHQMNITNGNNHQQSPLVAFNLHSNPQFYPNTPHSNQPTNIPSSALQNQQPQLPFTPSNVPQSPQEIPLSESDSHSDSSQNQTSVETSSANIRINSKLLINTTDIPALVQAINQENAFEASQDSQQIQNKTEIDQEMNTTQIFSEIKNPTPTDSTFINNTPSVANEDTQTFPQIISSNSNSPWVTQKTPLTPSQSLAILKGQISSQKNDQRRQTNSLPQTATQNTINIQVPSGSTVSANHNQADIADILTNLQILTVLMNQDGKNKSVMNAVQRIPANTNSRNRIITSGNRNTEFLGNPLSIQTHPSHMQQTQARTKAQLITSLPHYANQFAFSGNSQSSLTTEKSNRPTNSNRFITNQGNTDPRINYASISNFAQDDISTPFNQILSQLALSNMLNGAPQFNTQSTDENGSFSPQLQDVPSSINSPTNKPGVLNSQDTLQIRPATNLEPNNGKPSITSESFINSPGTSLPISAPNSHNNVAKPDNIIQTQHTTLTPAPGIQNSKPLPTTVSQGAVTETENSNPSTLSVPITQLSLHQLQQLETFNKLLNTFNNRHQNQHNAIQPVTQSLIPNTQDFILANILQQQAIKKPMITPSVISADDPYVPAIHGSNIGSIQSIFAQPPAPPPSSATLFQDNPNPATFPFPVRDAGSSGGGSKDTIQDCLKNTACALFLAGIVATGTTAALAIPVLTPLLGAGFLGKRRKRDISYFVIKPEDSLQFINDYANYANGTNTPGLTKHAECIFKAFMNPSDVSSNTPLKSLFKYIFDNKEKTLNITIKEIESIQQKPIPDDILEALKNDNITCQLDLLNSTLGLKMNPTSTINSREENDTSTEQGLNSKEDYSPDIFPPNTGESFTSASSSSSFQHDSTNQINSIPASNQNLQLHRHDSESMTSSQHLSNNQRNSHPLVPQPYRQPQGPLIPVHMDKPLTQTSSEFSTQVDSKFNDYLLSIGSPSAIKSTQYENILNTRGITTTWSPQTYNYDYQIQTPTHIPQTIYQSRNRSGHLSPTSNNAYQPQPQNRQSIGSSSLNEFYYTLCHALGEPGIPKTSVISFIAQRCLLFAHTGLIK